MLDTKEERDAFMLGLVVSGKLDIYSNDKVILDDTSVETIQGYTVTNRGISVEKVGDINELFR